MKDESYRVKQKIHTLVMAKTMEQASSGLSVTANFQLKTLKKILEFNKKNINESEDQEKKVITALELDEGNQYGIETELDVSNLTQDKLNEIIRMGCTFRHWKFRSIEQNYKMCNTCKDEDGKPVIV